MNKLSEAIRAGADIVEDAHGITLMIPGDKNYSGDKPCGCAIGTALYSAGERQIGTAARFRMLAKAFPVAKELPLCPVCDGGYSLYGDNPRTSPGGAIECLYEHHSWSRKAIAEWVETIENALEASSKPPLECKQEETAPESSEVVSTRQIESVLSCRETD